MLIIKIKNKNTNKLRVFEIIFHILRYMVKDSQVEYLKEIADAFTNITTYHEHGSCARHLLLKNSALEEIC